MEWKYEAGETVFFDCPSDDWKDARHIRCTIVRRLTPMDIDMDEETGPMYEVMFDGKHGQTEWADEDFLTTI